MRYIFDLSKTESLNIEIGGIYLYKNKGGFTHILMVTRITEKSIFVKSLLNDGKFSSTEHREGVTNFKKYILKQTNL